jgi:hypothetical protein
MQKDIVAAFSECAGRAKAETGAGDQQLRQKWRQLSRELNAGSRRPSQHYGDRFEPAISAIVVPAKAGTHTPQRVLGSGPVVPALLTKDGLWLWVPAFAGTTASVSHAIP